MTDSFVDELDEAKYIDLKYPTNNISTIRSSIFKLNTVSIY